MASILVTGGSGFVGKHLIASLIKKSHEVTSLSRKNINLSAESISLDLANYNPKEKGLSKKFDVIIHLAGDLNINEMIKNPQETISNNINSTLNILEDIRLNNPDCLLVFMSSEKVYGQAQDEVDENFPAIPIDPYGCSKLISEMLIKSYSKSYGSRHIIIRSGNIFGPGQKPGLFIPSVVDKILHQPEKVTVGNLEPYRNFIYVEDLVEAIMKCLEVKESAGKIFNLSAYNLKIGDLLEEIISIASRSGIKVNVVQDQSLFRPSEAEAKKFTLDCSQAKRMLNWEPKYSFKEAIRLTFESYLRQN